MLKKYFTHLTRNLESPNHPFLGPNLKGLQILGLWRSKNSLLHLFYSFTQTLFFVIVIAEFVVLWYLEINLKTISESLSLAVNTAVIVIKTLSFVLWQSSWQDLMSGISTWELSEINKQDATTLKLMKKYTKYARTLTYSYWICLALSSFFVIVPTFSRFLSPDYCQAVLSGDKEYPFVMKFWFPLQRNTFPGVIIASAIDIFISIYCTGCVMVYDANSLVITVFLKGQIEILNMKCRRIFDDKLPNIDKVSKAIKDCHQHHNFLIRCNSLLESVLSPVMFVYVLVTSVMICCSIVEITLKEATFSDKMFAMQIFFFLICQMFFYCWHGNEVIVESSKANLGLYESDWWKSDVRTRRLLLLLAGKLNHQFVLTAGPFTTLSLPAFLQILKASYSLYTFLTQIKE